MKTRFSERDMRAIAKVYRSCFDVSLNILQSHYTKGSISATTLRRMIRSNFKLDRYRRMCYEDSARGRDEMKEIEAIIMLLCI